MATQLLSQTLLTVVVSLPRAVNRARQPDCEHTPNQMVLFTHALNGSDPHYVILAQPLCSYLSRLNISLHRSPPSQALHITLSPYVP